MCDVGYLCVNFSLPSLSVLEIDRMYTTDRRKTDVRCQTKSSLNPPPIRGGDNNCNYVVVIVRKR